MKSDEAEALAQSNCCSLIGSAGCGKTHLIAEAVACKQGRCELILTHTNAGVEAIRRKLAGMGVASSNYRVETIAGWSLLYASSFPIISELATVTPTTSDDWNQVYKGVVRLLRNSPARDILPFSYSGIFVDEYQDCIKEQHELVLEISKLLPCRVLGDPLQGIFGFKNNILVEWERDVTPNFQLLIELRKPWRWLGANPELGTWLEEVREKLTAGKPIELQNSPVRWERLPSDNRRLQFQLHICREIASQTQGNIVVIHQWERQCHQLASRLQGRFNVVEPIDCSDLMEFAESIFIAEGIDRALALIEFAGNCITKIKTEMQTTIKALKEGRFPKIRREKGKEQLEALKRVAQEHSLAPVLEGLDILSRLPGSSIYRRELFNEMRRALREYISGGYESLQKAAWQVRNRTSRMGRKLSRCTIGRTLLIKGLEFDHAIILDADDLDTENLYVAMTRGTHSLTVLSRDPFLRPNLRPKPRMRPEEFKRQFVFDFSHEIAYPRTYVR